MYFVFVVPKLKLMPTPFPLICPICSELELNTLWVLFEVGCKSEAALFSQETNANKNADDENQSIFETYLVGRFYCFGKVCSRLQFEMFSPKLMNNRTV